MFKALLIGCGNIGALYDFETSDIHTHAKAYSRNSMFQFVVYDPNVELAKKVANKYGVDHISDVISISFSEYDCISICSPTHTHAYFLEKALQENVKVVICEKPISIDAAELQAMADLYSESNSKIIVNYIRRFQPAFIDLKDFIQNLTGNDQLINVNVTYQKGFLNNCSHAFDLLQFLFNKKLNLENIKITKTEYDFFEKDPTLSLVANWGETSLNATGLIDISFTIFEIDLFFNNHRIMISESGKNIKIYKRSDPHNTSSFKSLILDIEHSKTECIKNYMEFVITKAQHILLKKESSDNFMESVFLNQKMIQIIK